MRGRRLGVTRWAMAVDAAHCVGCQTCVVACQMRNALRPGVAWLRVDALEFGRWPDADLLFLPHACLHCNDAPCVGVCPTGASFQRADGVVLVDYETCIGCGVCLTACPYGARTINTDERWFFDAAEAAPYEDASSGRIGVAEKCTLCGHLTSQDKLPACVKSCAAGARFYGDLDDPDSDASKELAKYSEGDIHTLQDVGNHPATRYIMTSMIGQWQDRIAPADHPHTAAYPVAE